MPKSENNLKVVYGMRWRRGPVRQRKPGCGRDFRLLDERGGIVAILQPTSPHAVVWHVGERKGMKGVSLPNAKAAVLAVLLNSDQHLVFVRGKLLSDHANVPKGAVLNEYFHREDGCRTRWMDVWTCACDDKCPRCGRSITCLASREIKKPKHHAAS